jgi:colanic acid/amylovoran biosynthesis glycosyltransferase
MEKPLAVSNKIAYFTNVYPAVSHGFIRREILAVERQGMHVTRVALRGWDSEIFDDQDRLEQEKTRYVLQHGAFPLIGAVLRALVLSPRRFFAGLALTLRPGRRSVRPWPYHMVYLAEACRLVAWLREAGIGHVHAHFGTNSAEIVMLARVLGGPPYSFTVHGPVEFDNIDYFGTAEKIGRSAFTVAITDFTRSQLCRTVPYPEWAKIRVIRCGLDPEFFATAPGPVPDEPRITCIGRLVEQKGQQILIEAAARLRDRGRRFKLSVVGGGPMYPEVKQLVQHYGLEDVVELHGAVGTEQLLEELRLARALVLPSFAEGLPMVIMEAMALGRPVVSTYVAGIPELVVPGETGWLVPAGAVEPLADAVEQVLDATPEELQAMGRTAFARVASLHSADDLGASLASLFRASIVEESRAAAMARTAGAGV